MTDTMQRSWLVQRLRKPPPQHATARFMDNPFSFGGGRKNGGLSSEAMGLLREIFSFDYMGAAEFEHGAVPRAFQRLAECDELVASVFPIPLVDVPPHWKDRRKSAPGGSAWVYILCRKVDEGEVQRRITTWATTREHELKPPDSLMEPTNLASSLRPHDEWDTERCGWLELDNGFMFFTDKEMWAKTAGLFGIEAEAE